MVLKPAKLARGAIVAGIVPRAGARRLHRSPDPRAPALARATESIRGDGIEPAEVRWIERIERRRAEFAARPDRLVIEGSYPPLGRRRREVRPRRLAHVASIHRPWATFLLRLVRELEPRSCIELGASIGISAAYQGAGLELNRAGRLVTIERIPAFATIARETLAGLGVGRVEVVTGGIDEVLEDVLAEAAPIDLAFLDAAKTRDGALLQFERLLPHLAPGAALVMDDIHWSREMHGAWREIRSQERVAVSVDLWRLGACLLSAGGASRRGGRP